MSLADIVSRLVNQGNIMATGAKVNMSGISVANSNISGINFAAKVGDHGNGKSQPSTGKETSPKEVEKSEDREKFETRHHHRSSLIDRSRRGRKRMGKRNVLML